MESTLLKSAFDSSDQRDRVIKQIEKYESHTFTRLEMFS